MPAHIYIRVGRYKDAARVNVEAVNADEDYIAQCYAQGVYPLAYYPHNIHFIWASATNLGDSRTALQAARKVAEKSTGQRTQSNSLSAGLRLHAHAGLCALWPLG
jgi:hypothetical protein